MAGFYFFPKRLYDTSPRVRRVLWRVESWPITGVLGLFRRLPLRVSTYLAGSLFKHLGVYTPRAAKVRANLRVAFPQAGPRQLRAMTRGAFHHLGVAMAELSCLDRIWRDRERRIEFVVKPGATAPDPARRTVFVTAHLGAWQLVPLIGPRYGVDMPIIYAPEDNPYVDRRLAKLRKAFGSRLVARDGGIRVLMRALEAGASIGLTADTRPDHGVNLPFFGEEAPTNTVPARLALRYDCDVVPLRAERLSGGRYRVSVYPPVRSRNPEADIGEQARDMTAQINGLFEEWIRATPDQWLCMRNRWPTQVYARYAAR